MKPRRNVFDMACRFIFGDCFRMDNNALFTVGKMLASYYSDMERLDEAFENDKHWEIKPPADGRLS